MNRRNWLASIAAIFSGGVAVVNAAPAVRHVVLDYSRRRPRLPKGGIQIHAELGGGKTKVLVGGREIKGAWYVDTYAGIVCTYWVFPDDAGREIRANISRSGYREFERFDGELIDVSEQSPEYKPEDFPGREVDCAFDQALSETLRGKVQIVDAISGELLYGEPS